MAIPMARTIQVCPVLCNCNEECLATWTADERKDVMLRGGPDKQKGSSSRIRKDLSAPYHIRARAGQLDPGPGRQADRVVRRKQLTIGLSACRRRFGQYPCRTLLAND
jgi:hypothetical protein